MSVLDSFLSKKDDAEIKKINKIVDKIEAMEDEISSLPDEELRNKTQAFKDRLNEGESIDDVLVEAFAVAREA